MPKDNQNKLTKRCFVCQRTLKEGSFTINKKVNLPVCNACKSSDKEKKTVDELLDGMADGFVCGCI